MNFATTALFYLLVGVATAWAILLRRDATSGRDRALRAATALAFWPLYLPMLLMPSRSAAGDEDRRPVPAPAGLAINQELAQAIAQVEAELDLALGTLDGWSDAVLAREQGRFDELRAAWRQQAQRIAELDRLLSQPTFSQEGAATATSPLPRLAASESARRENIQRLQGIRRRLVDDLLGTLAKVRELVTMIHLARYTGAPAARAEELVEQIAAAVAGLTEVATWRSDAEERSGS